MKLATILPLLSLAIIPSPTAAFPVPAPADYGDYGSYPVPEGGYGSYAGVGAAEGAAAEPAPPADGGYGDYGAYPVPEGGYGAYKRDAEAANSKRATYANYGKYTYSKYSGYGHYKRGLTGWLRGLFGGS